MNSPQNLSEVAKHFLHEVTDAMETSESPEARRNLESLALAIMTSLEFEDRWWSPLGGVFGGHASNPNFITSDEAKALAVKMEEYCSTNALLGHGQRLKTDHVFGAGYSFEFPEQKKAKAIGKNRLLPARQAILDNPTNQELLFGELALKRINKTIYSKGNSFTGWDKRKRQAFRVYLSQITNFISDDDDVSRVKYFQRTYTVVDSLNGATPQKVVEWIPTDLYDAEVAGIHPARLGAGENSAPVRKDAVIIPFQPNLGEEQVFALPDAFPGVPWAMGYSSYLKDGAKLLSSLAAIAYQVKAKSQQSAARAGAKVASGKVAGTFIGGEDTEISQVPRANAVDLNTGRPLLSMTAAGLSLSTGSLATNVLEGGYASTAAVSALEKQAALSRQGDFENFFQRVFRVIGMPDGVINFNRIDADPIHRMMQSAGLSYTLGFINQQEGRTLSLELLDIDGDPTELPEPNEFTGSKAATLADYLDAAPAPTNADGSPMPSQGQSGAVGALADGDNELRDE